MTRDEYLQTVKTAFASEYAFYLKAQNFHWNIEGLLFPQFHALFGGIYEEVGGIIDDFAENIRKLDTPTPASFAALDAISLVKGQDTVPGSRGMLSELFDDSEKMVELFKLAYEAADSQGDYGLANFFADRQDQHKKHSWMLRASLK